MDKLEEIKTKEMPGIGYTTEPIGPKGNYNTLKNFIPYLFAYGAFTLWIAGITLSQLSYYGYLSKESLEQKISSEESILPKNVKKFMDVLAEPGKELAYFLYEKGIRLK